MRTRRTRAADGRLRPVPLDTVFDRLILSPPEAPPPEVGNEDLARSEETEQVDAPHTDQETSPTHGAQFDQASRMDRIAGMEVALFGAGAVASWVAMFLAFYGLVFHTFDLDRVSASNTLVGRTLYGRPQIGMYKVHALQQTLSILHPETSVHTYPYRLDEVPDIELERMVDRSNIVLGLVDHPPSLLRADALCHTRGKYLLCGALHRGARTGHVILSGPGLPCLKCSLELDGDQRMQTLHAEPGLGCDIVRIAHMVATMTLDILLAQATGEPIQRWDTRNNIVFLTNHATPDSPDGPAVIFDSATIDPACPVCGHV